jgi:hypothetical protein
MGAEIDIFKGGIPLEEDNNYSSLFFSTVGCQDSIKEGILFSNGKNLSQAEAR